MPENRVVQRRQILLPRFGFALELAGAPGCFHLGELASLCGSVCRAKRRHVRDPISYGAFGDMEKQPLGIRVPIS
jgi:hypothetical protein